MEEGETVYNINIARGLQAGAGGTQLSPDGRRHKGKEDDDSQKYADAENESSAMRWNTFSGRLNT